MTRVPHGPHPLFDRFGATGSLLCALHCAFTPLLLAALPSLGLSLWFNGGLEGVLVSFVTLLGLFSLGWSYRRHRAARARPARARAVGALGGPALCAAASLGRSARGGDDLRWHAGWTGAPAEPAAEPRPRS
ncbi:MerC domain-containing protein [Pseudoxanthomonas sp. NC8]|nr:MerC domain-containing protein [Pseudoxanthomonas sp. NC8]